MQISWQILDQNGLINIICVLFSLTDSKAAVQIQIYQCKICEMAFESLSDLKRHKACHISEKKRRCKKCCKYFRDIESHFRNCRRMSNDVYQCVHCKKYFSAKRSLVEHVRAQHQGRTYPCVLCGKEFKYLMSRSRHMSSIHNISN